MKLRHIISAKQFDKNTLSNLFSIVDKIKAKKYPKNALRGKIMATLFYEPSTRTRLSFESAMLRLGGSVVATDNAAEFSSAIKGETLEDTIRVVNSFCDVVKPLGFGVYLSGQHMCMCSRKMGLDDTQFKTIVTRGVIRSKQAARMEFLMQINGKT